MKTLLIFVCLCSTAFAQDIQPTAMIVPNAPAVQETGIFAKSKFHKAVLKASREARDEGIITRRQELQFRIAMYSPAFRDHAERLTLIQMVFSGSDKVPMSADGTVDQMAVDWDAFLAFLKEFIPYLLQIIDLFK